jgi:hypothetical protein
MDNAAAVSLSNRIIIFSSHLSLRQVRYAIRFENCKYGDLKVNQLYKRRTLLALFIFNICRVSERLPRIPHFLC